MALTYGFYNSVNHDRRYYSTQFSNIVNAMITDGVFLTRGNAFAVTPAANGLGVNVDTGFAWFGSTWTENDQLLPLTLTAADVSRPRIDAIVLDVNGNDDVRENDIIVVTGAPYSTPTKPTLINEGKHTQHALAYVTVNANATSILAENIEIVVGQNETPYADAKLSGIDITALFQQWQGEFETWFADVQSQLEGDVATNLLNKINALEQNKLDKVTDRATAEDLTLGAQDKWVSAGMLREESLLNELFFGFDAQAYHNPSGIFFPGWTISVKPKTSENHPGYQKVVWNMSTLYYNAYFVYAVILTNDDKSKTYEYEYYWNVGETTLQNSAYNEYAIIHEMWGDKNPTVNLSVSADASLIAPNMMAWLATVVQQAETKKIYIRYANSSSSSVVRDTTQTFSISSSKTLNIETLIYGNFPDISFINYYTIAADVSYFLSDNYALYRRNSSGDSHSSNEYLYQLYTQPQSRIGNTGTYVTLRLTATSVHYVATLSCGMLFIYTLNDVIMYSIYKTHSTAYMSGVLSKYGSFSHAFSVDQSVYAAFSNASIIINGNTGDIEELNGVVFPVASNIIIVSPSFIFTRDYKKYNFDGSIESFNKESLFDEYIYSSAIKMPSLVSFSYVSGTFKLVDSTDIYAIPLIIKEQPKMLVHGDVVKNSDNEYVLTLNNNFSYASIMEPPNHICKSGGTVFNKKASPNLMYMDVL